MKLSDALVLDARIAGELQQRSIAGQVEFWARLGRSVETLLDGRRLLALQKMGGVRPLSELLASVETGAGRKRLERVLANLAFPHFRQHPTKPDLLVQVEEDGRETVGRFVGREFVAAAGSKATRSVRTKAPGGRASKRALTTAAQGIRRNSAR